MSFHERTFNLGTREEIEVNVSLLIVLAVREIVPQSFQAYKAWIQEQSPKGNERVLADRPKLAVLGNRKLKHYLGQDVVIWQEELQRIIHQL